MLRYRGFDGEQFFFFHFSHFIVVRLCLRGVGFCLPWLVGFLVLAGWLGGWRRLDMIFILYYCMVGEEEFRYDSLLVFFLI
jgi:hypothetical protein